MRAIGALGGVLGHDQRARQTGTPRPECRMTRVLLLFIQFDESYPVTVKDD